MDADGISVALINIMLSLREAGEPVFADVYAYSTTKFTGTPSVVILPESSETEFQTTAMNCRTYMFKISIFVDKIPSESEGARWTRIRGLQDKVADAIDQSNNLGNNQIIVKPTMIQDIEFITTGSGESIVGNLSLEIKTLQSR